jgi:homoserine O-acetyltransferase
MELYDLSYSRNSIEEVAASIDIPSLFVGISSDVLYSPNEIERLAALFPRGQYRTLNAIHGHDSFLVDQIELARIIAPFLNEIEILKTEEEFAI